METGVTKKLEIYNNVTDSRNKKTISNNFISCPKKTRQCRRSPNQNNENFIKEVTGTGFKIKASEKVIELRHINENNRSQNRYKK